MHAAVAGVVPRQGAIFADWATAWRASSVAFTSNSSSCGCETSIVAAWFRNRPVVVAVFSSSLVDRAAPGTRAVAVRTYCSGVSFQMRAGESAQDPGGAAAPALPGIGPAPGGSAGGAAGGCAAAPEEETGSGPGAGIP